MVTCREQKLPSYGRLIRLISSNRQYRRTYKRKRSLSYVSKDVSRLTVYAAFSDDLELTFA